MTTTLKLGLLQLDAVLVPESDAGDGGAYVSVLCHGSAVGRLVLNHAEWQSLCDLAAERHHLEGHTWALQAQHDDVAEALGKDRLEASDGYHGTAVRELLAEHAKDREERERLTAERDKAGSELSLFTTNERDIVAMPGSDLANFQAEARRLVRERDRLRSFVTDLADEDCSYGDDCPSNARHYRCLRCKAKEALNAK